MGRGSGCVPPGKLVGKSELGERAQLHVRRHRLRRHALRAGEGVLERRFGRLRLRRELRGRLLARRVDARLAVAIMLAEVRSGGIGLRLSAATWLAAVSILAASSSRAAAMIDLTWSRMAAPPATSSWALSVNVSMSSLSCCAAARAH